ncbi:entericidin B membrane lipoprotein [Pseudooceanicola marinus]|uniref:Entericidin B membrane lipoprotein n=1 Tax=Pseudooceanicola marinus TaxID=396013 RepID=A0A1X6Z5Z8_9RHOB|nr:entericidin A/B family lipoprotein [Pseudooceanicola marinus]PJE32216.1 entericidin, EcnA/B family [Pseudooceanicola marinus]SLN41596.1 entericidin B membrane lipoprotein [Pseudooceanicola marinus]
MIRLAFCLAALTALTACETVKGAGRDLQTAGAAIEGEANRSQTGM